MNREEIARDLLELTKFHIKINPEFLTSVLNWHISEIAAAEKRGYNKGLKDSECMRPILKQLQDVFSTANSEPAQEGR